MFIHLAKSAFRHPCSGNSRCMQEGAYLLPDPNTGITGAYCGRHLRTAVDKLISELIAGPKEISQSRSADPPNKLSKGGASTLIIR